MPRVVRIRHEISLLPSDRNSIFDLRHGPLTAIMRPGEFPSEVNLVLKEVNPTFFHGGQKGPRHHLGKIVPPCIERGIGRQLATRS